MAYYKYDLNLLYEAFLASKKRSSWKNETQKFEHNWLYELSVLQQELEKQTYKTAPCVEFTLNERGKIRHIHGNRIRDRIVRHYFCDYILNPAIEPYIIYNNGASQKGKGISFTRNEFEKDLHNAYLKYYGKGCVVFLDLSKFYDNIHHDKAKEMLYPLLPKEYHWLLDEIFKCFEIDVSYMDDDEYDACIDILFNSVDYYNNVSYEKRTGQKYMKKSVNIGDQVSQTLGIFYPHKIDNYAKIVRGLKYYGRYMDDIYFMVETKDEAIDIINGISRIANDLGLFINKKKTHIYKLTDNFIYLQTKYFVTKTGKVVKRINHKAIVRERRKIKAYKRLLDKKIIEIEDIENAYKSWMGNYTKIMSKKQIQNMKELYIQLFGKDIRWKN